MICKDRFRRFYVHDFTDGMDIARLIHRRSENIRPNFSTREFDSPISFNLGIIGDARASDIRKFGKMLIQYIINLVI